MTGWEFCGISHWVRSEFILCMEGTKVVICEGRLQQIVLYSQLIMPPCPTEDLYIPTWTCNVSLEAMYTPQDDVWFVGQQTHRIQTEFLKGHHAFPPGLLLFSATTPLSVSLRGRILQPGTQQEKADGTERHSQPAAACNLKAKSAWVAASPWGWRIACYKAKLTHKARCTQIN